MKPNLQQQQNLKNYLRGVFKFRETYEEVFDHVLTAIEHRQLSGSFEDAVNRVIREDFGGANKLPEMEAVALNNVRKEGLAGYWQHFERQLYGLQLALPLLVGIGSLIWLKLIPNALLIAQCVLGLLVSVPAIIAVYRFFKVGYIFKDSKASIKDVVYNQIAMVPFRIYVFGGMLSVVLFKTPFEIWMHLDAKTIAVLFVLGCCYVQAYLKLFKEEFKFTAFNN